MTISDSQYKEIIGAGIQAPSADNSQPWVFSVGESRVDVMPDPSRTGLFFDSAFSATYISLGAVYENMKLCANRLGLQAEIEFGGGPEPSGFSLVLREGQATSDPLSQAIQARMTNRGLYRRAARVDAPVLSEISKSVPPDLDCRVHWASAVGAHKKLARAVMLADLVRFTHPRIHRDFHDKLRFGAEGEATCDGLDASTLGLEKPLLPLLKLLKPWGLSNFLNLFGLKYVMAWRGGWLPMWASGHIGVITAGADVDYFDMGRVFERVWLAATHAGLAFQPLGALPLLLFRMNALSGEGLSESHLSKLRRADAEWRDAVADVVPGSKLVMIFRVGRASGAVHRSKRRPLESFYRS